MSPEQIRAALDDRTALICTFEGEAASESVQAVIGVGCAIRNRVRADLKGDHKPDWWGEGFKDVCLKKWQFSCWWELGTTNTIRVYNLAESLLTFGALIPRPKRLAEFGWIADGLLSDVVRDNTNGATHYCTETLFRAVPPKWAIGKQPTVRLGAHLFFAGIES